MLEMALPIAAAVWNLNAAFDCGLPSMPNYKPEQDRQTDGQTDKRNTMRTGVYLWEGRITSH